MPVKHTSGEWDVNQFQDLDGERHVQVVLYSNGCPLAHMYECGTETIANARLMASAPALLDCLQEMLTCYADNLPNGKERPIVRLAREVITEALGK